MEQDAPSVIFAIHIFDETLSNSIIKIGSYEDFNYAFMLGIMEIK